MLMNSKLISQVKNKLKIYLKDKEILDIILFGSAIKGKESPKDIDIAIITNKKITNISNFHISQLTPQEFFIKPPSLINTLLREGYSLKHNKYFSEQYQFSPKVLFKYELRDKNPSEKVTIVKILKGGKNKDGLVQENKGEWIANQVFLSSIKSENLFEKFFINKQIKFRKFNTLIH